MKNEQELNEALREAQVAGDAVAAEPESLDPENVNLDGEDLAGAEVRESNEPVEESKTSFSKAVAQAAQSLGLSDTMTAALEEILAPLAQGKLSGNVVKLLAQAIHRDEDLKNADAAGYLRGRNEKIEIVNRTAVPPEAEVKPAAFPRYAKRSFWDDFG